MNKSLKFLVVFVITLQALSSSTLVAAEKRVALVIGNSNYKVSGNLLSNPVNDAELMSRTLTAVGFRVTKLLDANRPEMRRAMLVYSRALRAENTVGVFYYAGHGMQVDGQNYLLPIDAKPARKDELPLHGVSIGNFLRTLDNLSGSDGRLNIVILDACRNNPFARGWRSVQRGLATVDAPTGTIIAFATAPGDVASDGDGKNSPYTLALSRMIKQPGLPVEQTFKGARNLVWQWTESSGKTQIPWESTSLRGDFYFLPTTSKQTAKLDAQPKTGGDNSPQTEEIGDVAARVFPKAPVSAATFIDRLNAAIQNENATLARNLIEDGLNSENGKHRSHALHAWFAINQEFSVSFTLPGWLAAQVEKARKIANKRDRDYAFRRKIPAGGLRNLLDNTGGILEFHHDIASLDQTRGTAWSIYRGRDDDYSGIIKLTKDGIRMNMRLAVGSKAKCSFNAKLQGNKLAGEGNCQKQSGHVGYAPFPIAIELD